MDLVEYWEKQGIHKFGNRDGRLFIIDTPPPFTSGRLHMGHVLSYSYIDFTARYKRMRGYNVFFPQGWDTQGFPTEVKVEQKYGKLPRKEFVQKCKEWTEEMITKMKASMKKLGFSPDWRYEYRTMDPEYHKKVQISLIRMYKRGDVYRAHHPVMYCPTCKSAVAKTDVEEREEKGKLYFVRFSDLTIATTRPELIHACVALLVHPEDERYKEWVGKTVKTPFGREVPVIADNDVDKDFGTGVVMLSTYGDKQDVVWLHRHGLKPIEAIDADGRLKNAGEFSGLPIAEARERIVAHLRDRGLIVKEKEITHTVKIHDRCKTPIEFLPSYQWFVRIKDKAKQVWEAAQRIRWIPDFGIHHLKHWLDSLDWDWVISRQRMFGTPLPFYVCPKCGRTAAADESETPWDPETAPEKTCVCGAKMQPVRDVADCWVDSSITPLVIADWPNPGWRRLYPSDLRPQGVEIVRSWAFYTILRSSALTGEAPFKEILLNGNVLGPDGTKMSKSKGNIVDPEELLKQYPPDALRQWAAMSGAMAKDRPFSYEDLKRAKAFLNKLKNAARFVERFGKAEGQPRTAIDRWILSRLSQVIEQTTHFMEDYKFREAILLLQDFFWHDFCDDYIEFVKHRAYDGDRAAIATLRKVLRTSLLLLAPFIPFTTEEIYLRMFGEKKSIHLEDWPEPEEIYDEPAAEVFRTVVHKLRQWKASHRLSMGQPLKEVRIAVPAWNDELSQALKKVMRIERLQVDQGELNVEVRGQ